MLHFMVREDSVLFSDMKSWFLDPSKTGREENCSAWGGGGGTEAHFPNPPLLGRRDGRGGSGRGCPTCRAGGGGGPNIYGSK